jgi:hypothetical protein
VALAATAPAMAWLLAGSALRGLAAGLLAALGLSAIGGLFDDALRPRVLALFSLVWLLPSLIGPGLNAAIAVWAGWRWAMAWPAAVVGAARLLMGRHVDLVPGQGERRPVALGLGLTVVAGLVLASLATAAGSWGIPALLGGLLLAIGAGVRVVSRATDGDRSRTATLLVFGGLCLAFFGGDGLIPLAVVQGLGRGVVAGAVAIGAGLVAWSLTGLRAWPAGRRPDPALLGLALVALGLGAESLAQAVLDGTTGLAVVVAGWAVAGLGMGLAYARLFSRSFDDLAPERVAPVATAVAFAETAAIVLGSLLGGGVYSLLTTTGVADRSAIGTGFGLAALIALAAWAVARSRARG